MPQLHTTEVWAPIDGRLSQVIDVKKKLENNYPIKNKVKLTVVQHHQYVTTQKYSHYCKSAQLNFSRPGSINTIQGIYMYIQTSKQNWWKIIIRQGPHLALRPPVGQPWFRPNLSENTRKTVTNVGIHNMACRIKLMYIIKSIYCHLLSDVYVYCRRKLH